MVENEGEKLSTIADWKEQELLVGAPINGEVTGIEVSINWGTDTCKDSRLLLKLIRNGEVIKSEDIFGNYEAYY